MNIVDKYYELFNPERALSRAQSRHALSIIGDFAEQRKYDAASRGRRSGGVHRPLTSGAQEVSQSANFLAATAQELCRNNPLALRAKRVWANNIVGGGITLEVFNKENKKGVEHFNQSWDLWADGTDCDFEGHNNLAGLQWLWASTLIEAGGVLIRKHISRVKGLAIPLQLQTIEQSYLDKSRDGFTSKGTIIDGIQYNEAGQREGYWLLTEKTNTKLGKPAKSKFHKAENIIHLFRKDRAGQHLGVSWFAANATMLNNYNTYVDAKLMQQQIAACFALIFEEPVKASGVGGTDGTREIPDVIEPAMIESVPAGTIPHTINPPKADNSTNFDIGMKRDISVGIGITYEQLTGDYSLVNFASGRMGKNEFNIELDTVQKHVFKPALMKVFTWFGVIHKVKHNSGEVFPDWTYPARTSVNPEEEFDVLMKRVRNGMLSPRKAAKILGERFEKIVEEWKADKLLIGDLPFDLDPSLFASTGNQLNTDDAASSNAAPVAVKKLSATKKAIEKEKA